jgi:hypothetical protein
MFKAMVFLKRKAGITRQQFKEHYEKVHAPLFHKHFPPIPDYRRNYPVYDDPMTFMGAFDNASELQDNALNYDVITEVSFEDRKGLEELYRLLRSTELSKIIADDEDNFLDRNAMRVLVVEEHRSSTPPGAGCSNTAPVGAGK